MEMVAAVRKFLFQETIITDREFAEAREKAAEASQVLTETTDEARKMNATLRPYAESPDAFTALLINMRNERNMTLRQHPE